MMKHLRSSLLLAGLLLVGACGQANPPAATPNAGVTNPAANSSTPQDNGKLLQEAVTSLDPALCAKMGGELDKKNCEEQIGLLKTIKENKAEGCDGLATDELKSQCLKNIYISAGIQAKSTESCDKLTGETEKNECKDSVNINLAVSSLDSATCDAVSNEANKSACKSQVTLLKAKQAGDIKLCDELTDDLKSSCTDNIYHDQGIEKKDPSICNQITADFLKEDCVKNSK